jgi:hypothetical protein
MRGGFFVTMEKMQNNLPKLHYAEWKDTCATLHMWTQIVGKLRLVQTPWVNHSWHVPLYLTARGLTTSPIPFESKTFEVNFDLIDHTLHVSTSDGAIGRMELRPRSVADFYRELMEKLGELDISIKIYTVPSEVPDGIPFNKDETHASYDADRANAFFQVLSFADAVFKKFRARFTGKNSPVHFFWGSFDLAVTRFSGRPAPPHPGGVPHLPDWVAREAYSHEVSSLGFWPGGEQFPEAVFYSYSYPEPKGFRDAAVSPDAASFNTDLGEFVLPLHAVRNSSKPEDQLLSFAQTTYEAAADLAGWDRKGLERNDRSLPASVPR